MARGPKKHLKRLNAPKAWMLGKMDGIWAPRPSTGPHKLRECLPLVLILRNRLKYALTMQECKSICMERLVEVDGKVRTDESYPAGFMDVVSMPASGDIFRLLYDTKGRFVLHRIKEEEVGWADSSSPSHTTTPRTMLSLPLYPSTLHTSPRVLS